MNLRAIQFLCLLTIGSLFALTGLRQFFMEPLANPLPNGIWFFIQVLPLLAVLPGILRQSARSYLLAALAAMLYFCHGVLVTVTAGMRTFGFWEVGFSLALVLFASFAVRHLRTASAEAADRSAEAAGGSAETPSGRRERDVQ